jgi:hypothetical protein
MPGGVLLAFHFRDTYEGPRMRSPGEPGRLEMGLTETVGYGKTDARRMKLLPVPVAFSERENPD